MKCLCCDAEQFTMKASPFFPEVKGEEVKVIVDAYICDGCGEVLMDAEQMNALRRAASDVYREIHDLLTSRDIVSYRQALGMSQSAFASYLNVGVASIKRWETYGIQDTGQDEHLRLKCDEAYAEINALEVHWKSDQPDTFNGKRKFSWQLFKNAILFLVEATKSPLYLNKALFYADFKHFQKFGHSITGARYVPLDYGPCPDQYDLFFRRLMETGSLIPLGHHRLRRGVKADMSLFSEEERQTLTEVYRLARRDGGKGLFDLSHEEDGFKETAAWNFISYDFAKDLKI